MNGKVKIIGLMLLVFLIMIVAYKSDFFIKKPGTVKGLITWQYNDFVGTKPDVGATVFLLPSSCSNKIKDEDAVSYFLGTKAPSGFYYAKANGNGNYEIPNVKAGQYTAVIISKNTNRNVLEETDIDFLKEYILTDFFSKDKVEYFCTVNINIHQFVNKDIKVEPKTTLDLSNDFGNTYF